MFIQLLQSEVQTLEPLYLELMSLGTLLYPSAPEERVAQLREDLETLQKRLNIQKAVIPQR